MIELIVTCILSGTFIPPAGWTVVEVYTPNSNSMNLFYCNNGPCPVVQPNIKLTRTMQSGEIIEPPSGCQLQAKEKGR